MKASRLTTLIAAAAVSVAAIAVPTAGAEETPTAVDATVDTIDTTGEAPAETTNDAEELTEPDPNIAEQPTTPWLRILEGSSTGPMGVIITILFGIIGLGMAAYQQFGEYLPKLG